jgi:Family of unknown function (DUF6446)
VNGKLVAGFIVVIAAIAGGAMYYLQEYAFYAPVAFQPGAEIVLTPITSDVPEPILVSDLQGIDKDASPLGFRACFTAKTSLATLTEAYKVYDGATPLNAPGWFTCFDADKIGDALASGEAVAFLSKANVVDNQADIEIDRVVAVFPDGRAFAWNQLAPGTE